MLARPGSRSAKLRKKVSLAERLDQIWMKLKRPGHPGLFRRGSLPHPWSAWLGRSHLRDPSVPVREGAAGAAAAATGRQVSAQRASLADVLGGDPDVVAVDDRGAI